MLVGDIRALLKALRCVKIREKSNGWVVSTCPLARYTHGGGVDSTPSFGVLASEGRSRFRCLACSRSGDMSQLPFLLKAFGDPDAEAVMQFLRGKNRASLAQLQERATQVKYEAPPKVVDAARVGVAAPVSSLLDEPKGAALPESDLHHFVKLDPDVLALPTLSKRVITPRTYESWQIRWHPWAHRIAIPTRDHQKRLVGIAGRLGDDANCMSCKVPFDTVYLPPPATKPTAKPKKRVFCPECGRDRPPKYLHTKGFHRDFYLFGENRIVPGRKLFLVEGQFDTVAMHQMGYNAAGIMGTWLSADQIQKVCAWATSVVIVAESDAAGQHLASTAKSVLQSRVETDIVYLPEGRDIDELPSEESLALLGPPNLDAGC